MTSVRRVEDLLKYIDGLQLSQESPKAHSKVHHQSKSDKFKPSSGSKAELVIKALDALNIKYPSRAHEKTETTEAHMKAAEGLPGVVVRDLLLKEKRLKTVFLVIFDGKKPDINLKALGHHLKVGGGLRSADVDYYLSMPHGCVTPLAVIFDKHKEVQVIVDTELQKADYLNIYPGTNEATVCIKPSDLEKYCSTHSNPLQYMDFSSFFGEKAEQYLHKVKEEERSKGKGGKAAKKEEEHKVEGSEQEGITRDKFTEFGDWFQELVIKCELIDYTDISGCYVLRPASYYMWECIKNFMDEDIKKMGVSNTYFPLFVSEDALKREAKHFEDFSPEVAWVTHSGNTPLEKKLAVRPTSETIMYPMFRRWIRSFRDLPLKINQWCNVVRWEFKNPTPFLRTREFLWQEGHTAHPNFESAMKEVYEILDLYARTYAEVCAIPTIKGKKTKGETFPGADLSTTVEAYIPGSGRGIQGATSHCLGENFAKMFNIKYLDEKGESKYVVQNSWGFTTRSIGVMVMSHSDNKGLVLPPRVAQWQVVIIPIHFKTTDSGQGSTGELCHNFCNQLNKAGIRTFVDDRATKNPGFKFNEWELKGIPIRLELGPNDVTKQQFMAARRDIRDEKGKLVKVEMSWKNLEEEVKGLLKKIHDNLYDKAKKSLDDNIVKVTKWEGFLSALGDGKLVLAPHCNTVECEKNVAESSTNHFASLPDKSGAGQVGKAKALCIPLEQQELPGGAKCVFHDEPAKCWILFGRSY